MIKCEVCGKEFKTGQGLGGHMRWVHGIIPDKQHPLFPPKRFITDEQLAEMLGKLILVNYAHLVEQHEIRPDSVPAKALEVMTGRRIVKVGPGSYSIVD